MLVDMPLEELKKYKPQQIKFLGFGMKQKRYRSQFRKE